MSFVTLFLDREFPDFNFCETLDPDLRPGSGPSQLALIQMVHAARQGDRSAGFEFTDTMFRTLRPESFECFQRLHGPRAISYRDWFYAKLSQFLDILTYEKLALDGFGPDGKARTPETDKPWEEGLTVLGPGGPGTDSGDLEKNVRPSRTTIRHSGAELWMKFAGRLETASLYWRGSWAGCAEDAA